MPNLRGASPVGHDDGGLPSAAQSFNSDKLSWGSEVVVMESVLRTWRDRRPM